MYESGKTVKLSNEDLDGIIIILKTLEDSYVLKRGVTKTLKNDIKKGGFLSMLPMLLGTLGSSLIGNLLTGKGMYRTGFGNSGKGMYRTGEGLKKIINATKSSD